MDVIFSLLTPAGFAAAAIITVVASFVKGATGFAMPMIMISGMASFLDADLALAMLIIPTLAANLYQALGDGIGAAWGSARLYWRYLTIVLLFIAGSAQLVAILHKSVMFLILGIPITGFAILLLSGVKFVIPPHRRLLADLGIGGFAGFFGGISGVWGPPTVAFLTGIGANKNDSVRIQGVIYGAGAVVLTLSHLRSGVLNAQTIPLSVSMLLPMVLGLWIGISARNRMDEAKFRHWTLITLVVVGLNLIRRGVVGLI